MVGPGGAHRRGWRPARVRHPSGWLTMVGVVPTSVRSRDTQPWTDLRNNGLGPILLAGTFLR
ncbi:hypothetical protein DF044_24205 [Burkholderia contaminans]|uniref:Uncharacterized protein n=1 Tax=Burkholderia contaminans TaxID=488447 RepID=A0A3N8RN93_9BURK|nr:hypothetical protein DF035_24010 [Burkholderia contaminans]RQT09562.1 hypothetical protein DF044_24205 [Burkholderia contaminans]RQT28383.1 hypothetical protein DF036_27110 [Burkholderia contaminans]RQT33406.1 hypothetical protein DF037_07400 [Burkholderia contaminans]TCW71240.1 hypothetical protein C5O79_09455 [Burkholderia sp. SRS-25]